MSNTEKITKELLAEETNRAKEKGNVQQSSGRTCQGYSHRQPQMLQGGDRKTHIQSHQEGLQQLQRQAKGRAALAVIPALESLIQVQASCF